MPITLIYSIFILFIIKDLIFWIHFSSQKHNRMLKKKMIRNSDIPSNTEFIFQESDKIQ
ncbi:hypothetical protein pb186bvf_016964 [Paramecium bursaria]